MIFPPLTVLLTVTGSLAASLILTRSFLSGAVFSTLWQNHLFFRNRTSLHTFLTVVHTHHNLGFPFVLLLQCHTCSPFTNVCFFNTKCASSCLFLWLICDLLLSDRYLKMLWFCLPSVICTWSNSANSYPNLKLRLWKGQPGGWDAHHTFSRATF